MMGDRRLRDPRLSSQEERNTPNDVRPGDARPVDPRLADTRPLDPRQLDSRTTGPRQVESRSTDSRSADLRPNPPRRNDPKSNDTLLTDSRIGETKQILDQRLPDPRLQDPRVRQDRRTHPVPPINPCIPRRAQDERNDGEIPLRYSPPPSLKPYTIPRRAGQKSLLTEVSLDSRDATEVKDYIKKSLWNPEATKFEFTKIEMVSNEKLEAEYALKRKEMREAGRSKEETKDDYAFLYMRNRIEVKGICQQGLRTNTGQHHLSTGAACAIGDKRYGIYLCRCADVITRKPTIYQYGKENVMLVCRIMKGKPKTLNEGQGEELEPTCEFDSHMSVKFQRGQKMMYEVVYDVSQIYLYEVNLDNFSAEDDAAIFEKRPRQVLPYAVVYFKAKQTVTALSESPKILPKELSSLVMNPSNLPAGQVATDSPAEPAYEESLKNMKYLWRGCYFNKAKFLCQIQIGVFTKKEMRLPIDTQNITIQQKITLDQLVKILPARIYRKPPSKTLLPETDISGMKFLHGEIHPMDRSTDTVLQRLQSYWIQRKMAGVCTLAMGYKLFVIPSSPFTDKLGLSDASYPAVLHCIFMKENNDITGSIMGPKYESFIARQQLAVHSRLAENESLKSDRTDPNIPVEMKYAYTVPERHLVVQYLSQIQSSILQKHTGYLNQHPEPRPKKRLSNVAVVGPAINAASTNDTPLPISSQPAGVSKISTKTTTCTVPFPDVVPATTTVAMTVTTSTKTESVSTKPAITLVKPNFPDMVATSTAKMNFPDMAASSTTTTPVKMNFPDMVATSSSVATTLSNTSADTVVSPMVVDDEQSQQSIDFVLSFKRGGSALAPERKSLFLSKDTPPSTPTSPPSDVEKELLPPPPLPPSAPPPLPPPPPLPVAVTTPDSPPVDNINSSNDMTDSSQDSEDNLVINMDSDSDAVLTPTKVGKQPDSPLVKSPLVKSGLASNASMNTAAGNAAVVSAGVSDNVEKSTKGSDGPPSLKKKPGAAMRDIQSIRDKINKLLASNANAKNKFDFSTSAKKETIPPLQSVPMAVRSVPPSSVKTVETSLPEPRPSTPPMSMSEKLLHNLKKRGTSSPSSSSSLSSAPGSPAPQGSTAIEYTTLDTLGHGVGKCGDDNYDSVSMETGSEDSQDSFPEKEKEKERKPSKKGKKTGVSQLAQPQVEAQKKCATPSLSELNSVKENIMFQLKILTDNKRNTSADENSSPLLNEVLDNDHSEKDSEKEKVPVTADKPTDEPADEPTEPVDEIMMGDTKAEGEASSEVGDEREEDGNVSETESQGSEIIPFLGDDEDLPSDEDAAHEARLTRKKKSMKDLKVQPVFEKAQMAMIAISTEFYDRPSPNGSDTSSTISPPVGEESTPPLTSPTSKADSKEPVSLPSSTSSPLLSTVTSKSDSTARLVKTKGKPNTQDSSMDPEAAKIPFLSGKPCDRVPPALLKCRTPTSSTVTTTLLTVATTTTVSVCRPLMKIASPEKKVLNMPLSEGLYDQETGKLKYPRPPTPEPVKEKPIQPPCSWPPASSNNNTQPILSLPPTPFVPPPPVPPVPPPHLQLQSSSSSTLPVPVYPPGFHRTSQSLPSSVALSATVAPQTGGPVVCLSSDSSSSHSPQKPLPLQPANSSTLSILESPVVSKRPLMKVSPVVRSTEASPWQAGGPPLPIRRDVPRSMLGDGSAYPNLVPPMSVMGPRMRYPHNREEADALHLRNSAPGPRVPVELHHHPERKMDLHPSGGPLAAPPTERNMDNVPPNGRNEHPVRGLVPDSSVGLEGQWHPGMTTSANQAQSPLSNGPTTTTIISSTTATSAGTVLSTAVVAPTSSLPDKTSTSAEDNATNSAFAEDEVVSTAVNGIGAGTDHVSDQITATFKDVIDIVSSDDEVEVIDNTADSADVIVTGAVGPSSRSDRLVGNVNNFSSKGRNNNNVGFINGCTEKLVISKNEKMRNSHSVNEKTDQDRGSMKGCTKDTSTYDNFRSSASTMQSRFRCRSPLDRHMGEEETGNCTRDVNSGSGSRLGGQANAMDDRQLGSSSRDHLTATGEGNPPSVRNNSLTRPRYISPDRTRTHSPDNKRERSSVDHEYEERHCNSFNRNYQDQDENGRQHNRRGGSVTESSPLDTRRRYYRDYTSRNLGGQGQDREQQHSRVREGDDIQRIEGMLADVLREMQHALPQILQMQNEPPRRNDSYHQRAESRYDGFAPNTATSIPSWRTLSPLDVERALREVLRDSGMLSQSSGPAHQLSLPDRGLRYLANSLSLDAYLRRNNPGL